MKKIVIISDTHTFHNKVILPKGDILIHAGDLEIRNNLELQIVIDWFESLNFKHIIWVGGNHDFYLEHLHNHHIAPVFPENIHYLCNTSIEIEGIKFWGSPFSPIFYNWAFMGNVDELREIWSTIPSDTDIVITHCPAFGINDQIKDGFISVGCPALRDKLKEIKPKYHICGHIHPGYGIYQDEYTTYINGALLDDFYDMVNKPIEIEYEN